MVSYPTWKEEYNTGVKFIDEQHKYFLNIITDLQDCLGHGACKDSDLRYFSAWSITQSISLYKKRYILRITISRAQMSTRSCMLLLSNG